MRLVGQCLPFDVEICLVLRRTNPNPPEKDVCRPMSDLIEKKNRAQDVSPASKLSFMQRNGHYPVSLMSGD